MNIRQLLVSGLISIAVTIIGCASQAQSSSALSEPPPDVPATAHSASRIPIPGRAASPCQNALSGHINFNTGLHEKRSNVPKFQPQAFNNLE